MDEAIGDLKDFDFDEYEKDHEFKEYEEVEQPKQLTKKQTMIQNAMKSEKLRRQWSVILTNL